MDDIYKNIKEYNSNTKQKILVVFDDMIADMLSNKKLNPIVTELFCFCSKKYFTKFNTPFHYKNSKQKTASTISL